MPKHVFLAMTAATWALAGCSGATKSATPPAGKVSVWVQGVGKKVQPTTAPGSETAASVAIYRNATVSFQVAVYASDGDLDNVTVSAGDLSDGHGHTLAKANISIFRAAFIDFRHVTVYGGNLPVPALSPTNDSQIPDPLIPLVDPYTGANAGQPFGVKLGTNQPLFVDVFVPKATPAGIYTGNLHVTASGGLTTEVPVSLTAWDLDLPDMGSVTTHFRMSTNDLIQYHKGTWAGSGNNAYLDWNATSRQLVKRYEELAHTHRIDTGQNFVTLPENGCAVPKDWSDYDKAMQPYMDGSYWADGVASTRTSTPFSPGADYGMEATCTQAQYIAVAAAWAAHLKTRGWFARAIVYAADEPSSSVLSKIAQQSAWLQQGDPDWLAQTMDTTAPTPTSAPVLNPALGIYCTALAWYDNWNDHGAIYGRAEWPGLFAMGKQLWFYESNAQDAPYPTFATNTLDGLEPTIMMWGAWYEKATGFLYWDISNWDKQDPWGPTIAYGKTGDGVLIYPGNHDGRLAPAGSPKGVAIDGPIPSYRLQMVRAGLQDWALFKLAEAKGLGDLARTQVAQVYGQLGGCTYSGCPKPASGFFWKSDEDLMATVRKAVVEAILRVP